MILKTQQRFTSERHNIFTNKTYKNDLSSNNDKRMEPIDLIGPYAYTKLINTDDGTKENITENLIQIEPNFLIIHTKYEELEALYMEKQSYLI